MTVDQAVQGAAGDAAKATIVSETEDATFREAYWAGWSATSDEVYWRAYHATGEAAEDAGVDATFNVTYDAVPRSSQ